VYEVQTYPPELTGHDGRRLVAKPLRGEETCARCKKELTIVGYRDPRSGKTWPACRGCAREASAAAENAMMQGPVDPYAFVPYDDDEFGV
jgi:hypothetical protein